MKITTQAELIEYIREAIKHLSANNKMKRAFDKAIEVAQNE